MVTINYAKDRFSLSEDQSVLDCLIENGVPVPFSCRSGACQTCMMRTLEGKPTEASQQGLKDSLKHQNYFLACQCWPKENLTVSLPDDAHISVQATVQKLELLTEDILLVELDCHDPIDYKPGQFFNLVHDQIHIRSYSIASVQGLDKHIQLHVRRFENGRVSRWIHDDLTIGHVVEIRGPAGDCFYVPGMPDQGLILIGTGTGLAPLYGILRDALSQEHKGPIHLYHGSRNERGLYLVDEIRSIAKLHANFHYYPCLSGNEVPEGFIQGRADEIALQQHPKLRDWKLFLCGQPDMVKSTQRKAFMAGASMRDIYADAFSLTQTA